MSRKSVVREKLGRGDYLGGIVFIIIIGWSVTWAGGVMHENTTLCPYASNLLVGQGFRIIELRQPYPAWNRQDVDATTFLTNAGNLQIHTILLDQNFGQFWFSSEGIMFATTCTDINATVK